MLLLTATASATISAFVEPWIMSLLDEFKDIFSSKLPQGLHLLQDIQYQIDLVPGSALPNRLHFRISPQEHKELRRKVEELIAKGYIQESLKSVCSASAPHSQERWIMADVCR